MELSPFVVVRVSGVECHEFQLNESQYLDKVKRILFVQKSILSKDSNEEPIL